MQAAATDPMLATLGGCLALALGGAVLLLPLLVSELSRPRDAAWGAVVLLLGLVLVTSADRLTGAPMLAVLCGGLLIGRLGVEVGQARWRQLTPEERSQLGSPSRWRNATGQLGAALAALVHRGAGTLGSLGGAIGGLGGALRGGGPRRPGKRWVRPEPETPEPPASGEGQPSAEPPDAPPVAVVSGFAEIEERLAAATAAAAEGSPDEAG